MKALNPYLRIIITYVFRMSSSINNIEVTAEWQNATTRTRLVAINITDDVIIITRVGSIYFSQCS